MGTRAAIIVKVGNKYKGIYCHNDGNPDGTGVGNILFNFYNSQERAEALIALGDVSAVYEHLAPPEGITQTFDKRYIEQGQKWTKVTFAYGRDNGDTDPERILPKVGRSANQVADLICDFAYCYVFSNGEWKFGECKVGRTKLSKLQGLK